MVESTANNDFGFSLVEDADLDVTDKKLTDGYQAALTKAETKLDSIVARIGVFLDKLSENPTKTAIKWPNRSEVCLKLKNEILTLRNS
jgi:hypothetical protein